MPERNGFIFYKSFYEAISELDDITRLQIYDAITLYALYGTRHELSGISLALFKLIQPQIDANNTRYKNGCKGGRKPSVNHGKTKVKPNDNQKQTEAKAKEKEKENVKDKDKEKVNEKERPVQFAEFVSMTNDEYSSLVAKYGETDAKRAIEILDNYKGSSGKKYKSDYRTILNWVMTRVAEEKKKEVPNDKYANIQGVTRL